MSKERNWGAMFLVLFFCSGAAALVYEVVWSKYLALMFGSTIQAQTVVLAVFMGGLALGNWLLGRKSEKMQNPVRLYGIVELALGIYAFCFPQIYQLAESMFTRVGTNVLAQTGLLLGLKGALSVGLLLGPTVLMGGTLPLLARWLEMHHTQASRYSARMYAVNSLGAVLGAGVAGFYLVREVGMVSALQITALVNVLIGALAILISKECDRTQAQALAEPKTETSPGKWWRAIGWTGLLAALTGGVSMGLEVLASRSLSLLFGASLQSFAVVLMAFILGIGLGSLLISSPRLQRFRSEVLAVLLLLAAAVWLGVLVWHIESWVDIYRLGRSGLARSTIGYVFHQVFAGTLSMLVLGVPAGLLGSVLPLLIRNISSHLGKEIGRLLTCNTVGAVLGVLFTGFVLMPSVGLRSAFCILALGLCVAALFAAWRFQLRRTTMVAGLAVLFLTFVWGGTGESWRHVMSSGVFRAKETEVNREVMALRKQHIKILFYEDAPDATVSVEQGDGIGASPDLGLRINGKTDASSKVDLGTQLLVGHLPILAKPDSTDVFLLGLGSGITAGALVGHPLKELTVAENCEPVIRAAHFFDPWNRGVLTNPLVKICMEDARTVLKLSPKKYDVIITQPSNPWMAGVGSVFSREFYELASTRLKDGGIVVQWFHLYDMHDGIVSMVLRTFGSVFPYMEIWDCGTGDIVMLGAHQPWDASPEAYQRGWDRELPRKDLQSIGIVSTAVLLARQLASQSTAFAIAGDGPIQSDWFPVLEYEAPKAFYLGVASTLLAQFDERTRQSEIAAARKIPAIQSLSENDLQVAFAQYSTMNEELAAYLFARFHPKNEQSRIAGPWGKQQAVSANTAPVTELPPLPKDADDSQILARAVYLLEGDTKQSQEGVRAIEELLLKRGPKAAWPTSHYAALAVKSALQHNQLDQARKILDAAMQLDPANPQLNFLARIMERKNREPGLAAKM